MQAKAVTTQNTRFVKAALDTGLHVCLAAKSYPNVQSEQLQHLRMAWDCQLSKVQRSFWQRPQQRQ